MFNLESIELGDTGLAFPWWKGRGREAGANPGVRMLQAGLAPTLEAPETGSYFKGRRMLLGRAIGDRKRQLRRAECFVFASGHPELKGPRAEAQRPFRLPVRTGGPAFKVPSDRGTGPLPSRGLGLRRSLVAPVVPR